MGNSATLARTSDPTTSHTAAVQVASKLGAMQARMLEAFKPLPAGQYATANEAARWCVIHYGGLAESYRKRAKELVKRHLIEVAGVAKCAITGKVVSTYKAK